jgi:hypothetical protein
VADRSIPGSQVPYLRVVHGDASPEEIAGLVAVLAAVAAARSQAAAAAERAAARASARPNWNARARMLRTPVHPAPGGWRRSALP